MDLKFKVMIHVARPVGDVFEAVVDPKQLSSYFTTGGASGRLEKGATVMWDFADFPGAFPVEVDEVLENERIVFRWQAHDGQILDGEATLDAGYQTQVIMSFKPTDDGRTLVEIEEMGWRETPGGLTASYNNCMGWSQMLAALKMWVEHGINLREGAYK
ncbi:MAG TPA: SRPBCC domain-containing protein [Sphingomicrobium sp.]|nr:SRPBCC domain-containing protein [Sphingomicrobium sp.]